MALTPIFDILCFLYLTSVDITFVMRISHMTNLIRISKLYVAHDISSYLTVCVNKYSTWDVHALTQEACLNLLNAVEP